MKIVHVTCLTNNKASGISTIVPYHIKWQSQYARVFWINLSEGYLPPEEFYQYYNGIKEYPSYRIDTFPDPFNAPDLVVFHGIYFSKYTKIARQLSKLDIPYIVVPHGSLTKSALQQKKIKKKIGFSLLFGEFLKKSKTIQYLTIGEQEVSVKKWNNNSIVIPNGCEIPVKHKEVFNINNLTGVFIGRKSIYYKGLDILIEACSSIKKELEENNCKIHIYGPEDQNSNEILQQDINRYGLDSIIYIRNAVFNEEKVDTLLKSDFFILTSRTEGHPVALLEALSYGIPSVVTTGTNMAHEIEKYNAGWIADCNSKSIADAVNNVIKDSNKLSTIGKNAYNLAINYEWSNVAKDSIEKYRYLCNKNK